jgi:cyanophycinase
MSSRISLLVLGVLAFGRAGPAAAGQQGSLFIVGGGEQSPDMVRRFVELAGGPGKARIVVIPLASSEPLETGQGKAEDLVALGAKTSVLVLTREEALTEASAARLADATGIWFTGGDQVRITAVLLGTPVHRAIVARFRAGAVIGGTSAGAAIMSDSMITGNQYRTPPDTNGYYGDEFSRVARKSIEIVPGLGFLPGTIVDQHFIVRERHNRLLSVVLERPGMIGVGIDESTAIEVAPDGGWRVVGAGSVVIYDARQARITNPQSALLGATGIHIHILPSGSHYNPVRGQAELPSGGSQ